MNPPVLTPRQASALRQKAKKASVRYTQAELALGRVLHETKISLVKGGKRWDKLPVYRAWGYATWSEYIDKELGIHRRNGEYIAGVWVVFHVRLGKAKDTAGISICKLRILAPIVTKDNVNYWLGFAKAKTCLELEEAVRESKKTGLAPSDLIMTLEPMQSFMTRQTIRELKVIETALQTLREEVSTPRKGRLLYELVKDWLELRRALRPSLTPSRSPPRPRRKKKP